MGTDLEPTKSPTTATSPPKRTATADEDHDPVQAANASKAALARLNRKRVAEASGDPMAADASEQQTLVGASGSVKLHAKVVLDAALAITARVKGHDKTLANSDATDNDARIKIRDAAAKDIDTLVASVTAETAKLVNFYNRLELKPKVSTMDADNLSSVEFALHEMNTAMAMARDHVQYKFEGATAKYNLQVDRFRAKLHSAPNAHALARPSGEVSELRVEAVKQNLRAVPLIAASIKAGNRTESTRLISELALLNIEIATIAGKDGKGYSKLDYFLKTAMTSLRDVESTNAWLKTDPSYHTEASQFFKHPVTP